MKKSILFIITLWFMVYGFGANLADLENSHSNGLQFDNRPDNNKGFAGSFSPSVTRRYVTSSGAGSKNGLDWNNAYDKTQLQIAINESGVTEIWVAAGTYNPSIMVGGSNSRNKAFQLKNGVAVYGGFAGSETLLSDRNIALNQTILSGDLNGDDNYAVSPWTGTGENCYHVFNHPSGLGLNATAVLDGFTIRGGYASGTDPHSYGGGMYNNNNSPSLTNITFDKNYASGNGGALYNISGSNGPVTNSTFSGNISSITSGAVNNNASSPVFTGCSFSGNTTLYGGGAVANETNSAASFINCRFSENSATSGTGGALYNSGSNNSFTNCIFNGNSASVYGGALYNTASSSTTLTNCTVYGNSSSWGGGLYTNGNALTINNSIIWGNEFNGGTNDGRQIYFESGTNALNYSCYSNGSADISGAPAPVSCITSDPLFMQRSTGDFRIYGISGCADAGNNSYNSETTDIRGTGYGRKLSKLDGSAGTIDMGAYEYKYGTDLSCENTFEVTNTNDIGDGSLRNAINVLCNNGTITFNSSLNGQTITLTRGELVVNKGATIDASALASGITVNGNSSSRVFYIDAAAANVTVNKVHVSNGHHSGDGGGIFVNSGKKVSFLNSTISGCTADAGGGVCQASTDTVSLSNVTITGCSAQNGGGIKQSSGKLIATSSVIKSNTAVYQGGGFFQVSGTSDLSSSVIKSNSALWGAGIYFENGNQILTGDSIRNNTAIGTGSAGGAIYQKQGNLTLTGSNLVSNTAVSYGGAIYTETATANCTFSGGSVISNTVSNGSGGGLFIGNGTVRLKNSVRVKYNAAQKTTGTADGGGIYHSNGNLTLDTCFINNNTANRSGGGVYVGISTATLTATADSISFNSTVTESGGGLYVYQGGANLKRSIICGNTNIHKGAGIFVAGPTNNVAVDSCTISGNITKNAATDVNYGGGIFINNANISITNTAFYGNKATNTSNLRTPKGGAIYHNQGTLTSTKNTFTSNLVNTTRGLGGAMFNDAGTVVNTNCSFTSDSTGRNGGAIYTNSSSSSTTNTGCTFTSNYAANLGGVIYVNNGTLNNNSCTFASNKANLTSGAAAVVYQNNGTSTTKACTFNGNQANASAGFNLRSGTATIINSLFYDNSAVSHGGAITTEVTGANLTLINSTVTGNSAPTNGGGIGIQAGTVNIRNSIIWGNTSSSGAQIKSTSPTAITITNSDYSNETNDIVGTVTPTACINTYPRFVSEVAKDFRLGGNSPCADAGNDSYCSESYDIRGTGNSRKLNKTTGLTGTIDMGAYEFKNTADPEFGCTNPTSGGAIARNQTGCGSLDPAAIFDSVSPSGEHGTIEYKWQKSTTSQSTGFTDISGASSSSYDPGTLTDTTWFKRFARVTCMATWAGAGESNVVVITVTPTFVAGSISASQSVCYNTTPSQLQGTAPTGGDPPYTYQWQSSGDNTTFSNISGATGLNYQPGALTSTTYYRQLQSTVVCGTVVTNTVTVTVYPDFVAGSASASQSICYNTTPTHLSSVAPTGGKTPYGYQWQSSADNITFSDISGQTNSTYQPGALTSTTYYRLKQASAGGCGTFFTNVITIMVEPTPVSGTLNKTPDVSNVCSGVSVSAAFSAGSGGNGTDILQYRTQTGSGWSDWATYTSGAMISTTGKTGVDIRTYREAEYCSDGSTVTKSWVVDPGSEGGTLSGGQQVCAGTNSTLLTLVGYSGTITKWQNSTDGNSWIDISSSSETTYTASNVSVDTWYRVLVQSGTCPADSSSNTQITMVTYSISGYAKYENNPKTPLTGIKVLLRKDNTIVDSVVTSGAGYYEFDSLTNGNFGLVLKSTHPSGQWQTWGGVNNTDALIVNNHILGTTPLATNPPVVRTTASVKLPHPAIDNADYLALRQAAKFPSTGYTYFNIPKWVFSGTTQATRIDTFEMACANVTRDIRGLCAGDVNGTYVPGGGVKTTHALSLQLVNEGVVPITLEIAFPVRIVQTHGRASVQALGAITLYMDYDPSQIEITGVEMPENGGEEPWFEAKDGVLYIGWVSTNPVHMENEETFLLIHARLTDAFQISNLKSEISNLRIENRDLKSEISFALNDNVPSELANQYGNVISDVKLTIPKGANGKTANWQNGKMEIVSVYPNPAKESLNIELISESTGLVSFEFVNLQGIAIMKIPQIQVENGWSREKINISGVVPGVYMLKITCGDVTEIRKVVVNR